MSKQWIDDFASALADALAGRDAEVVVALDAMPAEDAHAALKGVEAQAAVHIAPASGTAADIRAAMLDKARDLRPDAVILVDADDVPLPGMVARHGEALAQADIAYGDMQIIGLDDRDGADVATFFQGGGVPDTVHGPEALGRTNFMGLTNTALGAKALAESAGLPRADIAAFDWWLFTSLLERGCTANRTAAPVTRYRHRRDGVLGARPDPHPARFAARCRMVAAHGRAFPHRQDLAEYGAAAERAAEHVARDPQAATAAIEAACAGSGVWFADVDRFLRRAVPA